MSTPRAAAPASADSPARRARKGTGKEAKLSFLANALMEDRNGLIVGVDVRHTAGTDERDGALTLLDALGIRKGAAFGADKGYDTRDFVAALTQRGIKAHLARNTSGRCSATSLRTARTKGYAMSQHVRKRIEQGFGWVKEIGGLCKLPVVGLANVRAWVTRTFAAYNLMQIGGIGG